MDGDAGGEHLRDGLKRVSEPFGKLAEFPAHRDSTVAPYPIIARKLSATLSSR
jgi:hypothetical protein